jgi:very-short-patch-repair endonuclease
MKKIDTQKFLDRKIFNDLDKNNISKQNFIEIEKILEIYNSNTIKNRLKNIYFFIKYNVDGDWVNRLEIIQNILKNDVMSEYSLEIRYGKSNVEKIKKENDKKVSHTIKTYISRYGEIDGEIKYNEYLKTKSSWGLKPCINKYGKSKGKKIWSERLIKKINTQKERKLIKPYRNGRTLSEYQNKYGIRNGFEKWVERNNKQSYRFSKRYYIETYGIEIGSKKWDEYKLTMNKTSLSSFIERYGKTNGFIKYEEHIKKIVNNGLLYSKISQELFYYIYEKINKNDKKNVRFARLNGEEIFYDNLNKITMLVDFKLYNKIIEFDGDYWHSNELQINKDNKRDNFLTSKGYSILRIKESEYKINKEGVINKCLNFLNN